MYFTPIVIRVSLFIKANIKSEQESKKMGRSLCVSVFVCAFIDNLLKFPVVSQFCFIIIVSHIFHRQTSFLLFE